MGLNKDKAIRTITAAPIAGMVPVHLALEMIELATTPDNVISCKTCIHKDKASTEEPCSILSHGRCIHYEPIDVE